MLEQLYSQRLALAGFVCWTSGLVLGTLVPFTTAEWLPLAAAGGLSLGAAATIANGLRIACHWLGLTPASRQPTPISDGYFPASRAVDPG
jgi:hypothetical protein